MRMKKAGEKEDKLILKNEEGLTALFTFVDLIPYKGRDYAVLEDEDGQGYIFAYTEAPGGKEIYETVEDEAVYDAVAEIFESMDD